jgi:hypothetical protein
MDVILLMFFFVMLVATFFIIDKGLNYALPDSIFAQQSGNITLPLNKTQALISQKDNVKILFTYQPERPIIDTFTKLEFNVINLTSNENLKDFDARVVVTNGQRLFKFENITVPDGDYSVEYLFPDDGTHQVITRIDKGADVQVLASFNVFVPHQAPPSLLNPFPNTSASEMGSLTRVLIIVISFAVVIVVIFMLRRGKRRKRKEESL